MSANVFISHATADQALASEVANSLRSLGISVDAGLEPGDEGAERHLDHIRRSDAVVVLLSNGASKSAWVMAELGAARILKKPILAFRPKHARVAMPFRDLQTVSLDRMSPEGIASTVRERITA